VIKLRDKDLQRAAETVLNELESMEDLIFDQKRTMEKLEDEVDALTRENSSLELKVKSLEEALAEAYLTSKDTNESTVDRKI